MVVEGSIGEGQRACGGVCDPASPRWPGGFARGDELFAGNPEMPFVAAAGLDGGV
jgi:hypothetical protein